MCHTWIMENLEHFRDKLGIDCPDQDYQALQDNLIRLGKGIEAAREELGIDRQVISSPLTS
jgi:hypothetical protein